MPGTGKTKRTENTVTRSAQGLTWGVNRSLEACDGNAATGHICANGSGAIVWMRKP